MNAAAGARAMRLAPLLVLALLLPGCVAPADAGGPPAAEGDASGARVLPWGLADCTYVVADVPVRADALRPFLPEGFEPQTVGGGPLAMVQGEAYLGIEAIRCAHGVGLDGDVADLHYGSIFTGVVPPADLAVPDVDVQFVKWDVLVPDAPRRDLLRAAGLPARAGSVTHDLGRVTADVRATLTLEGVGAFAIEGAAPREGGPFEGTFVEFMPSDQGGLARWRATYAATSARSGLATVTLEPGSWVAQVVGGERATAPFIVGRWSFPEGNVTLPG